MLDNNDSLIIAIILNLFFCDMHLRSNKWFIIIIIIVYIVKYCFVFYKNLLFQLSTGVISSSYI
jgi:hypothetical protein